MSHAKPAITVVRPEQFTSGTSQTSGSQRLAAITQKSAPFCKMWAGTFLVEPGAKTGIHHHGEQDTVVYVLEGEAIIRWEDGGASSVTVRPGDFLHVPAWTVHQEINPSDQHCFRWIVVRSTPEPVVVNLPGVHWD